ncbi:UDP-glucose 4-epimerase family protein [Candidatus Methylopumilus turicensis]|uniref:UDP-glucose 4-epimerase n=1 Tax=Candidatus Methylopumilus turicensis TaxID=1581680 RepID=A0A0B7IZQ2_9PROT|nr:SDR family oxidoreductase [Candidatus Methylopumilus turicensis]CEN55991.1 UDP-glucose 4-epimerase [Candidatus Methylopumilus turicensis]
MRILITGARGFVGRALCQNLQAFELVKPGRDEWLSSLESVDCVIHLAARVHVFKDTAKDPLAEYRVVNVEKTLDLARQASSLGVKRFIFVSSVKVNGELTEKDIPFKADDNPNPQDPYGVSKLEAENGLMQLAKKTGMEVVIVRPPLVYGPGVKANFLSMIKILDQGIPLPFGNVSNKRSLVFIDNLVDLLLRVVDHPNAAGQVFLVSDDHDVSTTTLLRSISSALGKKAKLLPVPLFVLKAIFYLIGKSGFSQRLLGSLCLDISKTKKLLNWTPPFSFEDGVEKTARSFLNEKS